LIDGLIDQSRLTDIYLTQKDYVRQKFIIKVTIGTWQKLSE